MTIYALSIIYKRVDIYTLANIRRVQIAGYIINFILKIILNIKN